MGLVLVLVENLWILYPLIQWPIYHLCTLGVLEAVLNINAYATLSNSQEEGLVQVNEFMKYIDITNICRYVKNR